ncbi:MAG TPA: hypothetical protein PLM51_04875, partial [Bacillota bacterium]|nr:hypothetical protein [Bacillota bacterium]
ALLLGLSGCALASKTKDYYATGNFNGWDTVESGKMTAISKNDSRVATIADDLKEAEVLYLAEIVLPDTEAGWTVTYKINGTVTELDGNLTVKVIRTTKDDPDTRDFWAQNPESGEITNLTPDTLYIPPFVEENVDQAGTWNDNPVAYAAGTYYIVFAEFAETKAMALIPVE